MFKGAKVHFHSKGSRGLCPLAYAEDMVNLNKFRNLKNRT